MSDYYKAGHYDLQINRSHRIELYYWIQGKGTVHAYGYYDISLTDLQAIQAFLSSNPSLPFDYVYHGFATNPSDSSGTYIVNEPDVSFRVLELGQSVWKYYAIRSLQTFTPNKQTTNLKLTQTGTLDTQMNFYYTGNYTNFINYLGFSLASRKAVFQSNEGYFHIFPNHIIYEWTGYTFNNYSNFYIWNITLKNETTCCVTACCYPNDYILV